MRHVLLLVVLIAACGGGPSAPGDAREDRDDGPQMPEGGPPPIPDGPDGPDGGGPPPIPDGTPQPIAGGRLAFSWKLRVEDCLEINAAQVEILSINLANGDQTTKRFPCTPVGVGATDQLAAGPYTIQISLFDDLESRLQTLPSEDLTINSGDDVSLGLRVFSF